MSSRIRTSHPAGHTPPNVFSDHDWIRRHQQALIEEYGEVFIVVYKEQVLGIGDTRDEAIENAERNLPDDVEFVTPLVDRLYIPNPFMRIVPSKKKP